MSATRRPGSSHIRLRVKDLNLITVMFRRGVKLPATAHEQPPILEDGKSKRGVIEVHVWASGPRVVFRLVLFCRPELFALPTCRDTISRVRRVSHDLVLGRCMGPNRKAGESIPLGTMESNPRVARRKRARRSGGPKHHGNSTHRHRAPTRPGASRTVFRPDWRGAT